MQPIVVTITQGNESKGLRLKKDLVEMYGLTAGRVQSEILSLIGARLFDNQITSQMIQDNIEVID